MLKFASFQSGLLLGLGIGFVARDLLSTNESYIKPFFTAMAHKGRQLVDRGLESLANLTERLEDMNAELQPAVVSKKIPVKMTAHELKKRRAH